LIKRLLHFLRSILRSFSLFKVCNITITLYYAYLLDNYM
jgi:hypothetical protein